MRPVLLLPPQRRGAKTRNIGIARFLKLRISDYNRLYATTGNLISDSFAGAGNF